MDAPFLIDTGYTYSALWKGHGHDLEPLYELWARVGYDSRPDPVEAWMVTDRNVMGFDVFYHRVPEGTEGAEPFTMLTDEVWPVDDDVEATRAACRDLESGVP
mgnify:CR=1 FL=1